MTPDVDVASGDDALAKDAGFETTAEMVEAAKRVKNREQYDRRKHHEVEELKTKVAELEERQHEASLGIGEGSSDTERRLARELRDMKGVVDSLAMKAASSPEDAELETQYDEALSRYPELNSIKDPIRRMEAYRRIARDLKAESEKSTGSDTSQNVDLAATHLMGDAPPVSRRSSMNEEQALIRYQKEIGDALNRKEADAITARYSVKFPDWKI